MELLIDLYCEKWKKAKSVKDKYKIKRDFYLLKECVNEDRLDIAWERIVNNNY